MPTVEFPSASASATHALSHSLSLHHSVSLWLTLSTYRSVMLSLANKSHTRLCRHYSGSNNDSGESRMPNDECLQVFIVCFVYSCVRTVRSLASFASFALLALLAFFALFASFAPFVLALWLCAFVLWRSCRMCVLGVLYIPATVALSHQFHLNARQGELCSS